MIIVNKTILFIYIGLGIRSSFLAPEPESLGKKQDSEPIF